MNAIIAEVSKRFGGQSVATGEIFPTNVVPVLWMEGNRLAPKPVKWGFPKWDNKGVIINARAETAHEKNMFRRSLWERRCVVPSTGFYEWLHVEGKAKKDKYLCRLPGSEMLYMAGMAGLFKDAAGQSYEAFCILTTAASQSMKPIHERMPVILMPDERETWLTDARFLPHVLERAGPELVISPAV